MPHWYGSWIIINTFIHNNMKTAKDLAYKAYCDALRLAVYKTLKVNERPKVEEEILPTLKMDEAELKERFENWWNQNVYNKEHRDSFEPVLSVFIEGKRYIQTE